ncbi:MAG: radical SAM protein [Sandaracinaceae bacterium]
MIEERERYALRFVIVETTRRCNLRCIHCAVSEENNEGGYVYEDLPFEGFAHLLPMLREHKPEVQLSGHGETTLHPRFERMLEETLAAGCTVRLQTNGTNLSQRVIDMLVRHGAALVVVSLDAAEAELFERIRRRSNFRKIVGNLERLAEEKKKRGVDRPRLAIEFVAMRQNVDQLADVMALAHRLGASEFAITELKEYPLTKGQTLAGDVAMVDVARTARELAEKYGMDLHLPPIPGNEVVGVEQLTLDRRDPASYRGLKKTCREPWERAFVQYNGDVWPCCWISESYGSLTKQPFDAIWQSERYETLRAALASDRPPETCVNCPVYGWEPLTET